MRKHRRAELSLALTGALVTLTACRADPVRPGERDAGHDAALDAAIGDAATAPDAFAEDAFVAPDAPSVDAFVAEDAVVDDAYVPNDEGPRDDAFVLPDAGFIEGTSSYTEETSFGTNPGNLRMWVYRPRRLRAQPAVVLALHGCLQDAADYRDVGWEPIADELGFYVVYAEQQWANNTSYCFNWFDPSETARTGSEVQSLAQMIDRVIATRSVDPTQVFVSGLSAGGSMGVALAVAYPEKVTALSAIASIPYGCATSAFDSTACTFSGRDRTPSMWASLVTTASPSASVWPRVQLWVGTSDGFVAPSNTRELMEQWTAVHGIDTTPEMTTTTGDLTRTFHRDTTGPVLVEVNSIADMTHGAPIDEAHMCGSAGSYILDVGVCSSRMAAQFFGLAP